MVWNPDLSRCEDDALCRKFDINTGNNFIYTPLCLSIDSVLITDDKTLFTIKMSSSIWTVSITQVWFDFKKTIAVLKTRGYVVFLFCNRWNRRWVYNREDDIAHSSLHQVMKQLKKTHVHSVRQYVTRIFSQQKIIVVADWQQMRNRKCFCLLWVILKIVEIDELRA
jgi:hypothetical protein